MNETNVTENKLYLIAWDLPTDGTRQKFYRRFRKIRETYSNSGEFMWLQKSLVITSSKKMAEEIYEAVTNIGGKAIMGEFIKER